MQEKLSPGAPPSQGTIPLAVPEIRGNEWKYIKECLDTNWVSSVGPFVDRFERLLAEKAARKYAVACVNGTAALHISLQVAGIKPGEEVLVSDLTFIAPANTIRYVGAWPVFIDAEPAYWQMDPEKVKEFLEKQCRLNKGILINKTTQRTVKAIMPVHVLGHPVDMKPLLEIARKYSLNVIEDATESLGAMYTMDGKERPVGSLGDIACFSFNGNKVITTGGGGMIVTDNEDWAKRAKYLTTQAKDDPLEYIHKSVGYNYRLTNIAAAMGVAQMEKLDEYIAKKRAIKEKYSQAFKAIPGVTTMPEAKWARSIFWMYTALFEAGKYGLDSRALLRKLDEAHIQSRPLWQPMHLSPAFTDCQSFQCEVAERLHRDALSLPSSIGLTAADQQKVIDTIVGLAGRKKKG